MGGAVGGVSLRVIVQVPGRIRMRNSVGAQTVNSPCRRS